MHSCGSVSQPVRIICIIQTNVIQFRALLCLAWPLNAACCDDFTALLCLAWPLTAARCDDFTALLCLAWPLNAARCDDFTALLCLAWPLNAARCDDIMTLLCLAWPLNAARCDDFTLVLQEGLTQLLRHSSHRDLVPGQHTCILRALMHQGELAAASRYLSMRNPPVLTAGDLKMRLTILVANRLVN